MSWIAKNSITGKTYGNAFDSIYDCQGFIDSHLKLLEYEFQRAYAMEEKVLMDICICKKSKKGNIQETIFLIFQEHINSLSNDLFPKEKMELVYKKLFDKQCDSRDIDNELIAYAKTNWLKNNIIRCWYVEQERFADGFDF